MATAASKRAGTANRPDQADQADQPTAVYEVISPLKHDLHVYAIGDQVELTEAEAAPLLGHTVRPGQG